MTSTEQETRRALEARRQALEIEIHGLRSDVEQAVGWRPRAAWALPLVGFAAGVSLALRFGGKKRRRLAARGR